MIVPMTGREKLTGGDHDRRERLDRSGETHRALSGAQMQGPFDWSSRTAMTHSVQRDLDGPLGCSVAP